MQNNPFDTLGGNELNGLFSSIKKVFKRVENVVRDVRDAVLPRQVADELSRAVRNPYIKAAGTAVAGVFLAPVVGAALGTSGAAGAISSKAIALAAVKGAGAEVVKTQIGIQVKKDLEERQGEMVRAQNEAAAKAASINADNAKNAAMSYAQNAEATARAAMAASIEANAKTAAQNAQTIAKAPDYVELVNKMREQGINVQQIQSVWAQSDTYKNLVTQNAANTVYPQLLANFISKGYTQQQAAQLANIGAVQVGADAASAASEKANPWPSIGKIAIPIIAVLLLGA